MAEDIRKGDLVKVIVAGLLKDQQCEVLHIEHNTERNYKLSDTWYLLDTRFPGHTTSFPRWFERHEIEPVTPEESRGVV